MRKGLFFFTVFLFLLGGCSEAGSVETVKLECRDRNNDFACTDFESQDQEVISAFEKAIKHAKKFPGILDYSAEYEMTLISSENEQGYALSLGSDPKMNGLLVKDSNSHQGYSIPLKDAEKLRDILGK